MTPEPTAASAATVDLPRPTRRDLLEALNAFWVLGLAVVLVGLAYLLMLLVPQAPERARVWVPYLVLGTLFPVVLALCVARPGRRRPTQALRVLLAASLIVAAAIVAGPLGAVISAGLACIQGSMYVAWAHRRLSVTPVRVLVIGISGFVSWAVMVQMFTWFPMDVDFPISWAVLAVGGVSMMACTWWVFGASTLDEANAGTIFRWLDVLAVTVLVLFAFRTDGLFITDRLGSDGSFYHWGVMVGPADAVRQGGWLLWDTPSPYGFLTTLTMAALPTATAWQSLYLLNATASAALAIWLYTILRSSRRTLPGVAVALAASTAVVFLVSTYPPMLSPEHFHPMAGAFRFGWCFVLIAVLFLERASAPGSRRQMLALVFGSVCWLFSMLWSAESAVYGSVIWLPAYVLIVLRDHQVSCQRPAWPSTFRWLLLPPLLLVAALTLIAAIYLRLLGHLPDALIYLDSVLAFTGTRASEVTGVFSETGFSRTVAAPVFGFLLLALVSAFIASVCFASRDLPVVLALALGIWALTSYPVGEPFLFASYRLMPFLVLALTIVIVKIVPRYLDQPDRLWMDVLRGGTISLLTTLLVSAYANGTQLAYYAKAVVAEGYHVADVTVGLPHVAPALEELMQEAGVNATDPIFYGGGEWGETMPVWAPAPDAAPVVESQQWLAGPLSAMALREDARKQMFLRRAAERQAEGGWLIERQDKEDIVYAIGPWFFEQVSTAYVPAEIAANDEWQLVRYEPLADWQAEYGDRVPAAGAPALPDDLLIAGAGSQGDILPEVWGYFGPEWTQPVGAQSWRCTSGTGTLNLFVPSAHQAELAFRLAVAERDLSVMANGAPVPTASIRGARVTVPLTLDAGWNVVAMTLPGQATGQLAPAEVADCGGGKDSTLLQIRDTTLRLRGDPPGP